MCAQSQDKGCQPDPEEASRRKVRVHGNFEELLEDYLSRRVPFIQGMLTLCVCVCVCVCVCGILCLTDTDSEDDGGSQGGELEPAPYEEFAETLDQFTRFSGWRELSSLNYGDQSSACSIVSSIEFDRDGEMFAVGGVTKKIKVSYLSHVCIMYFTLTLYRCTALLT